MSTLKELPIDIKYMCREYLMPSLEDVKKYHRWTMEILLETVELKYSYEFCLSCRENIGTVHPKCSDGHRICTECLDSFHGYFEYDNLECHCCEMDGFGYYV